MILIGRSQLVQSLARIKQSNTAAGDNAFFNRSTGCIQGIIDTVFFLFNFNFGSAADFQNSNTAGNFSQSFLQLFTVIIGGRFFNLFTNLSRAGSNQILLAVTVNDSRVIFGNFDSFRRTQHIQSNIFNLHAQLFGNNLSTGQNGNILQHGFAAIAETRSLNRTNLQAAANTVDNQRSQSFAFNVFCHNQQSAAGLNNRFQNRNQRLQIGNLLIIQQNIRIFELAIHFIRIGNEIRREIAAVKLHAFNHIQFGFQTFGIFHGNHAFIADLFHRPGNILADSTVTVS